MKIGIVGNGAFGSCLAIALEKETVLYARQDKKQDLPHYVTLTHDIHDLKNTKVIILAVPAQNCRLVSENLLSQLMPRPLVIAAKGIEQKTAMMLTDAVGDVLPNWPLYVLSGPAFASEIIQKKPAAMTLAGRDALQMARGLSSTTIRLYGNHDTIGVQVAGACKNVIAIACGVAEGLALGHNAVVALMTRGLAEIRRLNQKQGGKDDTIMGLSGVGDLALTCTSPQSRNMKLGMEIGRERDVGKVLKNTKAVTEGIATARAMRVLAKKHGIELPIMTMVDDLLNERIDIAMAIEGLMSRPIGLE